MDIIKRRIILFYRLFSRNLRWFKYLLKNRHRLVKKKVMTNEMWLDLGGLGLDLKENSISKQLVLDGAREPESTKIIKEIIRRGDVILEIGANIGYYVLLEASLLSKNGKIYAIEPEPHNLELLKKNVQLNNYQDFVEIYPLAVSDQEGTAKLYVSRCSNLHNIFRPHEKNGDSIDVKTVTVDGFLKDKEPVSFIRMDIEGAECRVINGMTETLSHAKKGMKLFIELHPHIAKGTDWSVVDLLKKLKSYGFEVLVAITHDTTLRQILGETTVEKLTMAQLIRDKRIIKGLCAFETFFQKVS